MAQYRGRQSDGKPNPIDTHVGLRLKLRRKLMNLSQEKLADLVGLTFQQIQKYELGQNRISASRLWDLAQVLQVSVAFFYEEIKTEDALSSPRALAGRTCAPNQNHSESDPMYNEEAIKLVTAYKKISNKKAARQIFDLLVTLSKTTVEKT